MPALLLCALAAGEAPTFAAQPTTTVLPAASAKPTGDQPAEAQPASTAQPSTLQPTTVQPTTVQPSTVQPSTVQPPTVQPPTASNAQPGARAAAVRGPAVVLPAELAEGIWQLITPELRLVLEVDKPADVELPVAIASGRYWLRHPEGATVLLGQLTVAEGAPLVVDPRQLRRKRSDEDPTQARPRRALTERHWTVAAGGGWQQVLAPAPARGGSFSSQPLVGLEVGFHNAIARGFSLGFDGLYGWAAGTLTTSSVSAPFTASQLTFGVSALYEARITERWVPFAGVRLALAVLTRSLSQVGLPDQNLTTLSPFALGGVTFRITPSLSLTARARLGVQPSGISGTPTVGLLEGGLFFGYGFL